MSDTIHPFGAAFLQARNKTGISQWSVAMNCRYHLRNIQRIEQGTHQPGVNLALRLISAIGLDAGGTGEFFETLWRESIETAPESLRNMRGVEPGIAVDFEPFSVEGLRCPFGPLLLQARLATGVTQKAVALASGYNLRNMNTVEKGGQEPGVTTALYMVAATGVDVGGFWTQLWNLGH